ncbi:MULTISPECIES: conjugal transfer pilus assembly protein TraH [Yersinia]|uniref:conjugal transfer pilus assembly protein TraH n=1 Tax=Yersinia TaxID=629 RepID=UPI0011A74F53|nr:MULTISPECIES: conjugal transfer pilus assembly protein TraH [Yersinia]HDL7680682.1 F-type conjugal transfer protein TraH [Yersinia enterocolitica]MCB5314364.1 F-type conjugal transfer protein TraH [Yersinia intermedia]MCB5324779.1 F-type conjugal transfer protein TraH [Yersinia intermedia]MCB5328345.1 F-type conjugal transfer protein TraH [Yersinia intermedia]MDN0096059.1 conjugal transfer pilus assembly protein TraH [Yersinia rohdei]
MRLRPLCLAFVLGLYAAGTAQAALQDDMNSFFKDMSYASNTTSAKAWQGQAARYVSGGSFYARTGNKNIQLVSISLPSINAGCGGIDVYLGAFSFINSDQITAFVKQTMANAAGYFFDLALETTVPELKAAKDFLQKMAADINRFNMSSCQAAKAMVDSVASLWGESQQNVCQSVGGSKNVFSDWVASRQGCTSGGQYNNVANKADGAEKDQVLQNINLMWDALGNSSLSSNQELRQFAMTISGSVIFGESNNVRILPSLAADRTLLSAMMNGGTAKVYVCDNGNKCLSPSMNNVTISEDKSLVKLVENTLKSIENKVITDEPLTENEKQFINSTSVPILSWIIDQSSLSVSQTLFAQLTDYIACDIYLQYLEAVMKVVNGSLATKDYPGANMKELKSGLSDARQALNSLRMEVQIKEDALISAQQQIRFIRQQVSSKMTDRVLGNYQFSRVN